MTKQESPLDKIFAAIARIPDGKPIVMINLLRYRDQAKYLEGSGAEPCSGREAYGRYAKKALGFIKGVGGHVRWRGQLLSMVIATDDEHWDEAFLVEYPSRKAFLAMFGNPEYQAIVFHRTAALKDSRLIATQTVE